MRIKVLLEIDKPLRRGTNISTGANKSKWVDVRYERIGDMCFFCGRLGHMERDCQYHEADSEGKAHIVYRYGPFLRASPNRRRNSISYAEREKQKQWMMTVKKMKPSAPSYRDPGVLRLGPPSAARKLLFSTPKTNGNKGSERAARLIEKVVDSPSTVREDLSSSKFVEEKQLALVTKPRQNATNYDTTVLAGNNADNSPTNIFDSGVVETRLATNVEYINNKSCVATTKNKCVSAKLNAGKQWRDKLEVVLLKVGMSQERWREILA